MSHITRFRELFKRGDIVDTTILMERMTVSRPTSIMILRQAYKEDDIIPISPPGDPVKRYMVI